MNRLIVKKRLFCFVHTDKLLRTTEPKSVNYLPLVLDWIVPKAAQQQQQQKKLVAINNLLIKTIYTVLRTISLNGRNS